MEEKVRIEFEGGFIKPLMPQDVHSGYVDGLNDPDVNKYLVGVRSNIQSQEDVTVFVLANQSAEDSILFGIWCNGMTKHCGTIRLHGIESIHKTAHIGICLFDKSVWGKKIGTRVIRAVTQWAFESLKLRWIEAGAYSENIASIKTFSRAGYEWVHDIEEKYLFEGRPTKVCIFSAQNSKN
jgi:RimJ/RimL family protein N-acetyltransferase